MRWWAEGVPRTLRPAAVSESRASGAYSGNVPVRKVEREIEHLSALRDASAAEALAGLRRGLADRVGLLVAKAAKIGAERQFRELVPDLLRAFDRLFDHAVERDPQCWGKNAIAAALRDLDHRESARFLRGMRHVQMEPVWGGQQDTAQTLRGTCLLALVACTDLPRSEIFRYLVDALTEKEAVVRVEAVRAVAQIDGDEAPLLLRLKANAGDSDPQVTRQVFDSVLCLDGECATAFVAAFLGSSTPTAREEAALALGSSRLATAVAPLAHKLAETRDRAFRGILLRALSLSRQPEALDLLISLVKAGRPADALEALNALAIHGDSEDLRRAVKQAVDTRESELQLVFERLFSA
jgi:hypothetical protein